MNVHNICAQEPKSFLKIVEPKEVGIVLPLVALGKCTPHKYILILDPR